MTIPIERRKKMSKKIYVGNMNYSTDDTSLKNLFSEYGNVVSARVIFDRMTGKSKGFGFVEMENDNEANAAITALNGKEVMGRNLRVNEAMEKPRN
jgi:RNA recognition motif-containing protein